MKKIRLFFVLALFLLFTANPIYSAITLSTEGTQSVGGDIYSNGTFSINYSVSGSETGTFIKAWGNGGTGDKIIWAPSTSGQFNISGLKDGDYSYTFEKYSGEVTLNLVGGSTQIPEMAHTVVVNVTDPDPTYEVTVNVTVDPHPAQTLNVTGTAVLTAGTVLRETNAIRVIVDTTPPILSNTNFQNLPKFTNNNILHITGNYSDNFLGGRVCALVDVNGVLSTQEVSVAQKSGAFILPVNLSQGSNKITLIGIDNSPWHNKSTSAQITVVYDNTIPSTDQASITFDPAMERGAFIGSKNYTMSVKFTDIFPMDTREIPICEIVTRSGNKITMTPADTDTGWISNDTWKGSFFIPKELGFTYDGAAILKIRNVFDMAGNKFPDYTENNIFIIDTTAPATNSSKPPIPNYIQIISPANLILEETSAINISLTDIIWAGGSGIDSAELVVWVDANGDGVENPKELVRFNDTQESSIDGTSLINVNTTSIVIDPTKLDPAKYFTRFTGEKVKVEIRNIRDSVKPEFGGPNRSPNVNITFNVNFISRPVARFIEWKTDSPEITTTPPLDASLSPPIPYDNKKLVHTPYKEQQIKFVIIPYGDIAENPRLAIDTGSVLITVNNIPFNINGSGQTFASPALNIISNNSTMEVVFNPALDPSFSFVDGYVKVKIAQAKDLNGTSILPVETAFVIDTSIPKIELVYPLDGGTTFDSTQEIIFNAIDELPGLIATIEVIVTNTTGTTTKNVRNVLRAGQTQANGDIIILKDPDSPIVSVKTGPGFVYDDGSVKLDIVVYDKATNKKTSSTVFWVLSKMELKASAEAPVVGKDKISVSGTLSKFPEAIINDTREVKVTAYCTDSSGKTVNKKIYFKDAVDSTGGKLLAFFFENIEVLPGDNLLSVSVLDDINHKLNFNNPPKPSDIALSVIYDNVGPIGAYNLKKISNTKTNVKFEWGEFVDQWSNPVYFKIQIAIEESFSTIIKEIINEGTSYSLNIGDFPHKNYYVRVIAVDSLDNEANPSDSIIFTVDSERPQISTLTIQDNTPDNQYSSNYPIFKNIDELSVIITFDEKMKKDVLLSKNRNLRIRLATTAYIDLTTGEWISDNTWKTDLSKNFFPSNYNGEIKVYVQGARDAMGNEMIGYISQSFYIDKRPEIEKPKIFPNPMDDREIMVLVRALEKLKDNPKVTIDGIDVVCKPLNNSWYGTSYRIKASQNGIRTLSITITDLNGNVGHWPADYTELSSVNMNIFRTASLTKNNAVSLESVNQNSVIDIAEGSVKQNIDIYSMIYEDEQNEVVNAPRAASSLNKLPVKDIEKNTDNIVYAPAIKLEKDAQISFSGIFDEKHVVMKKVGNKWKYIPTNLEQGKIVGKTDSLGTFAVFRDNKAPSLNLNIADNEELFNGKETIRLNVDELGSGIKNVVVYLDDKIIGDTDKDIFEFTPTNYFKPGEHVLRVTALDNANNSVEKRVVFKAPAGASFNKLNSYPNPAVNFCEIKYNISAASEYVELKIYDVSGKLVYKDKKTSVALTDSFIWNLDDRRGNKVANGVYIYKLIVKSSGVNEINGKIAVLR